MSQLAITVKKLDAPPVYRWYVLFVHVIVFAHFFMSLQLISVFGITIQRGWKISATEVTLLITSSMIAYTLFPLIGGAWGAKWGPRRTVTAGILIDTVATLLFPVAGDSYFGILALRFIQGISGGLIIGAIVGGTSVWFPTRQRGIASGILFGFQGVGFAVPSIVGPMLTDSGISWQTASAIMVCVPGVILAAVVFFTVKGLNEVYPGVSSIDQLLGGSGASGQNPGTATGNSKYIKPKTMKEALRRSRVWAAAVYVFVNGWLIYGLSSFLPRLLSIDLNIPDKTAAAILGATFFVSFVTAPLGGIVSDFVFKGRRYPVLLIGALLSVITIAAVPYTSIKWLGFMLILAYASTSIVSGPFWSLPSELVDSKAAIRSSSMYTIFGNGGGAVAAPILAYFSEAAGSGIAALYICVGMAAAGVVSAWFIRQ
ncbi:MFS transporter [Paenibacillus sabinae]|uniref:MFS transporter n=1 Tax=Paenibacillus sabinae T27 TaxID=1268072 RepID=X4ZW27_9BACL|nr:MFS transporter [Paenibacillus sabinae]AHV95934.1 MFS transporter [Paenibacillus sabinae T27]